VLDEALDLRKMALRVAAFPARRRRRRGSRSSSSCAPPLDERLV